ncbi:MAG: glycerophosphatase [Thermoleophilia bacterium]|nr:glycerophosphatase [Thermoleophilia bacterium]
MTREDAAGERDARVTSVQLPGEGSDVPEGMQSVGDGPIAEPPARPRTGLLAALGHVDHQLTDRILVKARLDGTPKPWVVYLRRFSEAGSYGVGWVVLFAIVGIFGAGLLQGAVAAACVIAMLLLNTLIKGRFKRPRPLQRAIEHAPGSYSFPSAHTSMAMVGAATMSELVGVPIVWWLVAAGLGWSRVMLGMHFLGDVVAGAALGLALGLLVAAPLVHAVG